MSVGDPNYLVMLQQQAIQSMLFSSQTYGGQWPTTSTPGNWTYYHDPVLDQAHIAYHPPIKEPHGYDIEFKPQYKNEPTPIGVEMLGLYDVVMVYAEDRKKPVVEKAENIIAASDEDAKIKSGLMGSVNKDWDADYLTFVVKKVGDIRVKSKPQEVKQV